MFSFLLSSSLSPSSAAATTYRNLIFPVCHQSFPPALVFLIFPTVTEVEGSSANLQPAAMDNRPKNQCYIVLGRRDSHR